MSNNTTTTIEEANAKLAPFNTNAQQIQAWVQPINIQIIPPVGQQPQPIPVVQPIVAQPQAQPQQGALSLRQIQTNIETGFKTPVIDEARFPALKQQFAARFNLLVSQRSGVLGQIRGDRDDKPLLANQIYQDFSNVHAALVNDVNAAIAAEEKRFLTEKVNIESDASSLPRPPDANAQESKRLDDAVAAVAAAMPAQGLNDTVLRAGQDALQAAKQEFTAVAESNATRKRQEKKTKIEADAMPLTSPPPGATKAEQAELKKSVDGVGAILKTTALTDDILNAAANALTGAQATFKKIQDAVALREQRRIAVTTDLTKIVAPTGASPGELQSLKTATDAVTTTLGAPELTDEVVGKAEKDLASARDVLKTIEDTVKLRARVEQFKTGLKTLKDARDRLYKGFEQEGLKASNAQIALAGDALSALNTPQLTEILVGNAEKALQAADQATGKAAWAGEKKRLAELVPGVVIRQVKKSAAEWEKLLIPILKPAEGPLGGNKWKLSAVESDINANKAAREEAFLDKIWSEVAKISGSGHSAVTAGQKPLTRDMFWTLMGWGLKGNQWNLRIKRKRDVSKQLPEIHVTASGDSIPDPGTVDSGDNTLLDKSPAAIFRAFFEGVNRNLRAHVTRQRDNGSDHIYVGDVVADNEFGNDKQDKDDVKLMVGYLADFQKEMMDKISAAKIKGWKA